MRELPGVMDIIVFCPKCKRQHIDVAEWARRVHKTHRCMKCAYEWQPATIPTRGVKQLARLEGEKKK